MGSPACSVLRMGSPSYSLRMGSPACSSLDGVAYTPLEDGIVSLEDGVVFSLRMGSPACSRGRLYSLRILHALVLRMGSQ